ncbi:sensor histidine kinase [Sinanaerobacter chloroacetimidivorans]|uniref:Sensor histidine kinase n=1 Tax=Sinanaerobacter chloroacetimidivorans TaxID=2818044 RepID=A0A8J7W4P4_9FIRM|nr:ATP-binding protein [Sinanaerobacter chloroacetimidivorans]MBR0600276.1 sensor histidine kinase [Sinanaerobacter chloroacetimidivorans]
MKRLHRTQILLITGMIFAIFVSHLPVMYTFFYHELTGTPESEGGRLQLSAPDTGKTIILDGEWELYWNRLLVTEKQYNVPPDLLLPVPDYWSRYQLNGSYLPANGYASYRLTLDGYSGSRPVTVYLPDFGSAYRVYIDGSLTSESGTVSKNQEDVFTTTDAKLYPVTLSAAKEHEIVIEIATTRFSGLYMAPILQSYDSAILQDSGRNNLRMILFGTVLFSFFVLVMLYILTYRKNNRSIWLPVIGFFVLVRIMMTTEFYHSWQNMLFFHLSYEDTNPLMFLVSFVFKYLLIFLVEELLGIAFSRREKLNFLIYYILLYLLYLFIPHGFYNRHLTILLPVCAFAIETYLFFKVYHNRHRMKKYGLLIYWGTILAITGLIIDCYYINGNIYLNLSLSLLLLLSAYLMILSMVSAMQAADVYRDFAVASAGLEQARSQISMQTEYYDALREQINEVRAIRHDVRHFIGAIRQLTEERRYEDLTEFLSDYVEKADPAPLPVFCENIVANSILGYYSLCLKKRGIPFRCTCQIPAQLSISDSDLCIVLGNVLENAMEACGKQGVHQTRYVAAEARNINGQFLIKITNTYNGIVNQRDGSLLSTKIGASHGLGLQNIKKVVNACGGIVKTEHNAETFTLMVALPVSYDAKADGIPSPYKP